MLDVEVGKDPLCLATMNPLHLSTVVMLRGLALHAEGSTTKNTKEFANLHVLGCKVGVHLLPLIAVDLVRHGGEGRRATVKKTKARAHGLGGLCGCMMVEMEKEEE